MKSALVLSVLVASSAAFAEATTRDVWVARPTGATQCERIVQGSNLGEALQDLESKGVVVKAAKVGRLKNIMTCSACNCPDGFFHLALVKKDGALADAVGGHGDGKSSKTIKLQTR